MRNEHTLAPLLVATVLQTSALQLQEVLMNCDYCGCPLPRYPSSYMDEETGTVKRFCLTSELLQYKRLRAHEKRTCEDVSR